MKKTLLILLSLLVIDVLLFSNLFFPHSKLLVTPEFGAGDNILMQYPYRYEACQGVKILSVPFWNKNLSLGYPLFVGGELSFFQPVNLLSCLLFNYKTAFNIQIIMYVFLAQIGCLLLGKELKLRKFTSFFTALALPFVPMYVMNYMQIMLIFPVYMYVLVLYGLLRFLRETTFKNWALLVFFISLQILIAHWQAIFITVVFSFTFLAANWLIRSFNKKNAYTILFCLLAYIIAYCLVGIQTIPSTEFFLNSNRFNNPFVVFGTQYDQNMSLSYLATFIHPFILGSPIKGTYPFFAGPDPWESTFYIYAVPGILSILGFIFLIRKNKFVLVFSVTAAVMLLLAFGKNSPLYFVHAFPGFSAFRFPSRYVLLVVFALVWIGSFGLDFVLQKMKGRILASFFLMVLATSILLYEIHSFYYSFHVFTDSHNVYPQVTVNRLQNILKNGRVFSPYVTSQLLDSRYVKGYEKNSDFYYTVAQENVLGNIGVPYQITTAHNKSGPELKRMSLFLENLADTSVNINTRVASMGAMTKKLLQISAVDHLLSPFIFDDNDIHLQTVLPSSVGLKTNLYTIEHALGRVQFYENAELITTLEDFYSALDKPHPKTVFIENKNILVELNNNKNENKANWSYTVLKDTQTELHIHVTSKNGGILVIADPYYPGWFATVDDSPSEIFYANVFFRGVTIPKGNHTLRMTFIPRSFYLGLGVSGITTLFLIIGLLRRKRKLKVS